MVIHKSPQKHFEYVIAYGRSSHMEVWLFHVWRHLSLGSSAVPLFVISCLYSLNCSLYAGKNPWIGLLHFSWLPSVGHVSWQYGFMYITFENEMSKFQYIFTIHHVWNEWESGYYLHPQNFSLLIKDTECR